ncbi:hypothetical protein [Glutamicibacter sp. BW77]|uniref:hypothetical protein n=1 Tax=Glutamicibacter TaxID=1742989 RepID=UPI000BB87D82|nr:hypothetical protein [Glutamicibacter sp. BW77]PCC37055.1 hypothetical protein CIK74_02610 [Glutamicibacter sp. BW77]
MLNTHRKDIHLSLSPDQYDDLTSALETHLNGLHQFAKESALGFGLETTYWSHRVAEVQGLLEAVHRLAAEENPDAVNQDLQRLSHDSHEHPHS